MAAASIDPGIVYLLRTDASAYSGEAPYHPFARYPEYPFRAMSGSENRDYGRVRDLLANYGLDGGRFGTPLWNPLGGIIRPGNTVLIKPNMVMHVHERGLDIGSVITWGSVIRPVVDYAYRALGGNGRIIIADAPLQACDFGKITELNGCAAIAEFYGREAGFALELLDLRSAMALKDAHGAVRGLRTLNNDPGRTVAVDLGGRSCLAGDEARYRVTNYSPRVMRRYHGDGRHRYLIPRGVLEADVIINMPKPKAHRKAGVSIAMKNMVGAAGEKACLPHHRLGSRAEGGDEYLRRSALKRWATRLQELMDEAGIRGRRAPLRALRPVLQAVNGLIRRSRKDPYREGSWWGNETIGAMICDLNAIITFSDLRGEMRDSPQRTQLVIADGIIAGEGEGPLGPDPVHSGFLAIGLNAPAVDSAVAKIMGFDPGKIPHIRDAFSLAFAPPGIRRPGDVSLRSNHPPWSGVRVSEIPRSDTLLFRPPASWAGHIELEV